MKHPPVVLSLSLRPAIGAAIADNIDHFKLNHVALSIVIFSNN